MNEALTISQPTFAALDRRSAEFNNPTRPEWIETGVKLSAMLDSVKFWLADWYIYGGEREFYETHEQLEMIGLSVDVGLVREYATVAKAIPPKRRSADLSFNHYKCVADLARTEREQMDLIKVAVDESLTVPQLRRHVSAQFDEGEPKPKERMRFVDTKRLISDLVWYYGRQDFAAWDAEELEIERERLKPLIEILKALKVV